MAADASAHAAVAATAGIAGTEVAEEAAAVEQALISIGVPLPNNALFCAPICDTLVARLVNTLIDIVGIGANNRGCTCLRHQTCGMQGEKNLKVLFVCGEDCVS